MGWGSKAIEIRAVENGQLDGVFMHKRTQKLRFLCERNDKVSCLSTVLATPRHTVEPLNIGTNHYRSLYLKFVLSTNVLRTCSFMASI